jgi:FtsH-binding integral membrane protein
MNVRETVFAMIAAFSFLVLSTYLVLWKDSNRDLRIVCITAILFVVAIVFSRRKDVAVGGSFLFAAIRWALAAIVTHELRAITATVVFLSVPALLLFLDSRKRKC